MKQSYIVLEQDALREIYPRFLAAIRNSIFKKYNRWSNKQNRMKIFKIFSENADREWIFIDTTHVRAHQHSAGIPNQDISKSVGGNSSKIHLAVDSLR